MNFRFDARRVFIAANQDETSDSKIAESIVPFLYNLFFPSRDTEVVSILFLFFFKQRLVTYLDRRLDDSLSIYVQDPLKATSSQLFGFAAVFDQRTCINLFSMNEGWAWTTTSSLTTSHSRRDSLNFFKGFTRFSKFSRKLLKWFSRISSILNLRSFGKWSATVGLERPRYHFR